ncbi:MAG: hypothetical protein GXO76_09150 [Calditrichaeota bacterium]|nr:hypothetical protein [Calditrichota bacterium]
MNACKKIQSIIPDYVSGDLPAAQKKRVDEHIRSCSACRTALEQEKKLAAVLGKSKAAVPESFLQENRERLHARLLQANQKRKRISGSEKPFWRIRSLTILYRVAAVAVVFVAGVWLGTHLGTWFGWFGYPPPLETTGTSLSSGGLHLANWNPRKESVRILNFDPKTQTVTFEVEENRRLILKKNVNDPQLQQMVASVLRPASQDGQRLRAIRILNQTGRVLSKEKNLSEDVVRAICWAARRDANPGVRLKAIRTLGHLSADSLAKGTLMAILQNDSIPAIRYEALNALIGEPSDNVEPILKMLVREDSSSVLRMRAENALRKIERRE